MYPMYEKLNISQFTKLIDASDICLKRTIEQRTATAEKGYAVACDYCTNLGYYYRELKQILCIEHYLFLETVLGEIGPCGIIIEEVNRKICDY